MKGLRADWAAESGKQPPEALWRDILLRMLTWRLQERAFGGHDKRAQRLVKTYGQGRAGDKRCQRLKAGTVLVREFGGTRHAVTIGPNGFIWQEETWGSLTAIARAITGTNWNGPRFFGLRKGEGNTAARQAGRTA